MHVVRAGFRQLARLARTYTGMDRILATSEPVALVVLLASWLTVAVLGFTLVNWGIGRLDPDGPSPRPDRRSSRSGSPSAITTAPGSSTIRDCLVGDGGLVTIPPDALVRILNRAERRAPGSDREECRRTGRHSPRLASPGNGDE